MKLFCFPWSGGNGSFFYRYRKELPEDVEIIPVDGTFSDTTPFRNAIQSMVDIVLNETDENESFILFGHCMGAVLAFETLKVLAEERNSERIGLLISGMIPPSREMFQKLDSEIDLVKMVQYEDNLGMEGTADLPKALAEVIVKKMNTDIKLLKRYESCSSVKPKGPVSVIFSEQDDVSLPSPTVWNTFFEQPIEEQHVLGKHFYLLKDFSAVSIEIRAIKQQLEDMRV